MGVGYSDLTSMKLVYPGDDIDLLLDDNRDDGLGDEGVFGAINATVGADIRHKLTTRYSDQFTAWETAPHEKVENISDRMVMYRLYLRKGRKPPINIEKDFKASESELEALSEGKESLDGVTVAAEASKIRPINSAPRMNLGKVDPTTRKIANPGTLDLY